jgi:Calcineurin-like phosphoesterase
MLSRSETPALVCAAFFLGAIALHGCGGEALAPPYEAEAGSPSGGTDCDAGALPGGVAGAGGAGPDELDGPASHWPAQPRVVVIGDLHSDVDAARQAFRLAGGTDENDAWVGGALTIVQLGDMIGRSDAEREVLDFLFAIREQAEAAGGKVHLLVGNHEVMGARVDNQAVGMNPFPGYEDLTDLDLEDARLRILPDYAKKRGAALMSGGPYAKRFSELPTVLQLGETVYVHGGVVPRWAEYGLDRINAEVSHWLFGACPEPESSLGVDNGDKVMWTRQFSSSVDATDCALLDQSLAILGAKRMIVAHTVQSTITGYCDDKVWAVDVGMSRYYAGPIEVLEIVNDEVLTVLHL